MPPVSPSLTNLLRRTVPSTDATDETCCTGPDARHHLLRLGRQRAGARRRSSARPAPAGGSCRACRAGRAGRPGSIARCRAPPRSRRCRSRCRPPTAPRGRGACAGRTCRRAAGRTSSRRLARDLAHAAVSDSIAPSRITTCRRVAAATSWSCVITTIVVPSAFSSAQQRQHVLAGARVEVAGRLVGQHDRRAARRARARSPRAGARRPTASPGVCVSRWPSPTRSSVAAAARRRSRSGMPAYSSPSATLSTRALPVEQEELLEHEPDLARAQRRQLAVGQPRRRRRRRARRRRPSAGRACPSRAAASTCRSRTGRRSRPARPR